MVFLTRGLTTFNTRSPRGLATMALVVAVAAMAAVDKTTGAPGR